MTVSTEVDHNDYTGNGVTTSFPYTFRIFQKSDLMVQVADLNENITVLTLDTDYTVTGAGGYSGGAVVLASPLANGWQISISRELPVTQETDLRNQGKFFAEVHEDAFDKLTMLIQQCFGFLRLALRKPTFIANYYDALNNRIKNLRDPSQDQDAATKKYVDSKSQGSNDYTDMLFRRTLHVRDGETLTQLPSSNLRKGKLQAYDSATGDSLPIFPGTVEQQTALDLQSADGLKYIGRCPTIAALRIIEPTKELQKIDVAEYASGGGIGGGYFIYDESDTTSLDDGGSIIVTAGGARWKRDTDQLLPEHFNAVPGATINVTQNLRNYISASANKTVVFKNGPWLINGTLDLSSVRKIIADPSGKIFVDPAGFSSLFSAKYALTFGNPDLPYGSGRATAITISGILVLEANNRSEALNGVYVKGALLNFEHLRISGFNGAGFYGEAMWDSTFTSVSCELCGNESTYQFGIYSGGDTSNCLNFGRIQSEQAYHKCLSIACIRSFIGPIHAERTYITTSNDGTSGILSGLNYINFYINVGNTTLSQMIHDCVTSGTAPDGRPLAATIPSVVLNVDFGKVNSCSLTTSYITSSFGRYSNFDEVRCNSWFFDSADTINNTVRAPFVSGTLHPSLKTKFIGGFLNSIVPNFNAANLSFDNIDINSMTFSNTILGNIEFNKCRFPSTYTIASTQTPSGYSGQSTIGETMSPTTFNECDIKGTVTGAFQSRAIFNGGYIGSVNAASRAAIELYRVTIGSFNHQDINNRGYITRQCKCANVTAWHYPNAIYYHKGLVTERIGDDASSLGQQFFCASNSSFTWTKGY
ncbi:hypothetical protein RFG51_000820 [Klebsiella aerogenes]